MSKYQAYPEYKDSGVEWLKEIPKDWSIVPLKYLAELTPKKSELEESIMSDKCTFLPMEKLKLNSITLDEIRTVKDVYDGYTYFKDGDVLIAKVTPCFENKNMAIAAGLTNGIGFGSSEIYVLRPNDLINNRFLYYRLQEDNFMAVATGAMTGAGGLKRVPSETVNNFTIAIPTTNDQTQIAAFLDHETAKIDTLIEKQQQLIELLKEKRQAVISHAVTKGLNPQAPMKDSGVEWLGEVPEHWVISRVKNIVSRIVDGPHFSPKYVDDGYMFISARNIKVDRWSLDDAKFVSEQDFLEFNKRVKPEKGDVLLTKGGTTGIARAVDLEIPFQVWVHVAVLKTIKTKIDPFYFAYVLNGSSCYEQSQLSTYGATNNDLGLSRIAQIILACPPLDEQKVIKDRLDSKCSKIDDLVTKAQQQVALMQERRTALISAAVTGKIDVRHWIAPTTSCDTNEVQQEVTA
ncbi:restriction endonuclease subunit S [Photobacterium damselae]|uniref:restriction endonuclease subunit S n=1 Tax=Photobacterium damselae TaxID=38293 RepID=UPI004068AC9B